MDVSVLVELSKQSGKQVSELAARDDAVGKVIRETISARVSETAQQIMDGGSEELRKAMSDLKIEVPQEGNGFEDTVISSLSKAGASKSLLEEAQKIFKGGVADAHVVVDRPVAKPIPVSIDDVVPVNVSTVRNPNFEHLVALGNGARIGMALGLKENTVQKLSNEGFAIGIARTSDVEALVKSKVITRTEGNQLSESLKVAQMIDNDANIAEYVSKTFEGGIKRSKDLLKVSSKQWQEIAKTRSGAAVLAPKDWAGMIHARVEAAHPELTLRSKIKTGNKAMTSSVNVLLKAEKKLKLQLLNKKIINQDDLKGLNNNEIRAVIGAHKKFRSIEHKYPSLDIAKTLNEAEGSLNERLKKVTRLTSGVDRFIARNEGFLDMDLSASGDDLEKLDFSGIDAKDRPVIQKFARSYQRIYMLAETPDLTARLANAGIHSALQVSTQGLQPAIEARLITDEEAREITIRAERITPGIIGIFGSVLGGYKDWFGQSPVGNTPVGFEKVLKDIPGFEDFFGSQDFCDCQDCRSILGPAAYFVDLMRFVDESVSSDVFTGANADHPLNLKVRRPDLWTLPLTCENTNTLIPILQIVCEVVESFIADQQGFTGNMGDLNAIANFVYGEKLPQAVDSFIQPFVLPIEEIKIFLSHYDLTLNDISKIIGGNTALSGRMGLGLSKEEFDQITIPQTGIGFLKRVYGVEFAQTGSTIRAFEPKLMYPKTALTRDELGRAILTKFVTSNETQTIKIIGKKRSAESVQNDMENITGLTRSALDRMRRLTLASRALEWSFDEIDVAIDSLISAGRADTDLTPKTLNALVGLKGLAASFRISLDEAIALVAPVPVRALEEDGTSLLDNLFNTRPYQDAAPWPDGSVSILLPAFAPMGTSIPPEVARLQAGLQIDDENLTLLVRALAPAMGIDPDAESAPGTPDLAARSIKADITNISLLYRHARLLKLLKINAGELEHLIGLAPELTGNAVDGYGDVAALSGYVSYLSDTKRTVDEIRFITGQPTSDPSLFPSGAELATQLIDIVNAEESLLFNEAFFTTLDGISLASSAAIIGANPALFTTAGESLRLTATYNPLNALSLPADSSENDIEIPADIRADSSVLHDVLTSKYAPHVIAAKAAILLETKPEKFATAIHILGTDLASPLILDSLIGVADSSALTTIFNDTAALCLMLSSDVLEQERLDFIRTNRTALFGIGNPRAITANSLRRVDNYGLWIKTTDKSGVTSELDLVLKAFTPATAFTNSDSHALASVLECDVSLSDAIQSALTLSKDPFLALNKLNEAVTLARRLAIGGSTFSQIASEDFNTLSAGSEAIQAGIRSKYETIEDWEEKVEPYRDRVLSRRRDGLISYLVASIGGQFESADDLYRYFLIDAQMEGCGRTSRVVSANATLQLYVQRIMLNLEETPAGHSRPLHILPSRIDTDEWSWRKNYRVWEANRRVFLYPENYCLPELRDNKTEIFEEFEEVIASQDINSDSVRDAYSAYMRGFESLSRLKISGTFLEKDTAAKRDVLHLFGVTTDDPNQHYYRRVENFKYGATESTRNTEWGAWRKVDLKIPVEKVSPIIHQGRLFIFWTEISTVSRQEIKEGTAEFAGYNHKIRLLYSTRRLDGTWAEPQDLTLDKPPFYFGNGVVVDENVSTGGVHYEDNVDHPEPKDGYSLSGFAWDRVYPEHFDRNRNNLVIQGMDFRVNASVDFYNLSLGDAITATTEDMRVPWIDPLSALVGIIVGTPLLFPSSNLLWSEIQSSDRRLFKGTRPAWPFFKPYALGSLLINREDYDSIRKNRMGYNYMLIGTGSKTNKIVDSWGSTLTSEISNSFTGPEIIRFDEEQPHLQVLNGAPNDAIIDVEGALFSLMDRAGDGGKYRLARLNSSLAQDIARTLFEQGVDAMLDIKAQEALSEHSLPFNVDRAHIDSAMCKIGDMDYSGPMGVYIQEIYFHLPVAIAKALNAQGDFAAARNWFHYVFDPTASEQITNIPAGLSAEEQEHRKLDRVWRYRRFRGRETTSLRDILEDEAAIETYKRDPFNPHAIARTRISVYQKYVVMAYVDNLLDEADSLFATDLREQINEAVLLYVTALDILGPRPQKLGDCGEKIGTGLSYEDLSHHIAGDNDMLLEIETVLINRWFYGTRRKFIPNRFENSWQLGYKSVKENTMLEAVKSRLGNVKLESRREIETFFKQPKIAEGLKIDQGAGLADFAFNEALQLRKDLTVKGAFENDSSINATRARTRVTSSGVSSVTKVGDNGAFRGSNAGNLDVAISEKARLVGRFGARDSIGILGIGSKATYVPSFGWSLIRSIDPIFCVPENDALKGYWDRVEDRLFKIRNCMNIDGIKRPLALFAPRIDPLLLVRARAAGLSIDDVVGAGAGELPPFRFRYLLERARSAVGMAKSMGDAMQRALTSKDAEELSQIRNTQQANILSMGKELKVIEIDNAQQAIDELGARKALVQARRDHYIELIGEGDLDAESVQKVARVTSGALKLVSTGLTAASGFASLVPDVGAPTTIEWGGTQISRALKGSADSVRSLGDTADLVGMIAGMVAANQRRGQGWAHQKNMAEFELATFPAKEKAAQNRLTISERNLSLHETQISHQNDIIDFYEDKFTGLGLYTHLASNLQRLYRQAFNLALAYARLAESAYRFETGDDAFIISGTYWDSNRVGLLAGETLTIDLSTLEQRYVEGRRRKMEVNQTFSLSQLNPAALMQVRSTGGANFTIPEYAFDLFYPGQYKRRIKAVRLTIPCIAGPYTNISATLALTESFIRNTSDLTLPLSGAPRALDALIASSTAQSDAGIFELNFKDERYLPFEGAGAISSWRLDLPRTFRPFNYDSITDVLINISYEADYDSGLRDDVEDETAAINNSLAAVFEATDQTRIFSLRQEASAAYQRLIAASLGTNVDFEISDIHFPLFIRGKNIDISSVKIILQTAEGIDGSGAEFALNTRPVTGFADDANFGDMSTASVSNAFPGGLIGAHTIVAVDADTLGPDSGTAAMSHDKIKDIFIVVEYTVSLAP